MCQSEWPDTVRILARTNSVYEVHSFVDNVKENCKSINDNDSSTVKSEGGTDEGEEY